QPLPPPLPYTTLFRSTGPVAQARRLGEPESAGEPCGLVREDVSEHVLGQHHVEAARVLYEHHRGRIDQRMVQLDVAVVFRHLRRSEEHTSELQSLAYL